MKKHLTCISYDKLDFLVPSDYIVSGIHLSSSTDTPSIIFNRETLPHLYIGQKLQDAFCCEGTVSSDAVLVLDSKYFAQDVKNMIVSRTDTAFPASGNVALSVSGSISSHEIEIESLRLMPSSIRNRMTECGVCAIRYDENNRKQLLISPDALLRRFFSGGIK